MGDAGMTRGSPGPGAHGKATSCSFPLLLPPGLPLGLPGDCHAQRSSMDKKNQGLSRVPPARIPLCTASQTGGRAPPSSRSQASPPQPALALSHHPPPGRAIILPRFSSFRAPQATLQAPIAHLKRGGLLDGRGGPLLAGRPGRLCWPNAGNSVTGKSASLRMKTPTVCSSRRAPVIAAMHAPCS